MPSRSSDLSKQHLAKHMQSKAPLMPRYQPYGLPVWKSWHRQEAAALLWGSRTGMGRDCSKAGSGSPAAPPRSSVVALLNSW